MFQNHLLQLLMITAMEAPVRYEADAIRDEKVKVLQAIRPLTAEDVARDTLRGQYRGYLNEPDVPPNSQTATFAAVKLRDRQLALARRAVLSAQRQGACPAAPRRS